MIALIQSKTMLKTMPSIQIRTEFIGAMEKSPIQPWEACQPECATAKQIINRAPPAWSSDGYHL
jgi:hypothetical protein